MFKSLLSLLWLAVVIWALLRVLQSNASTGKKIIWGLIIFLLPVIGVIAWYFAGPK